AGSDLDQDVGRVAPQGLRIQALRQAEIEEGHRRGGEALRPTGAADDPEPLAVHLAVVAQREGPEPSRCTLVEKKVIAAAQIGEVSLPASPGDAPPLEVIERVGDAALLRPAGQVDVEGADAQ